MSMNRKRALREGGCAGLTCAIYCRKSTSTEGKSKSRDEQLELCLRDAESYGFGSVLQFIEPEGQKGEWFWQDAEGLNPGPHRPELTRMVQAIERGEVHAVVAYKTHRVVRSTEVMIALRKVFLRHGVRVISQGRDTQLETARGKCQLIMDSASAEEWRDQISEDVQRDHLYKAENGWFTRNPSCFGFRSCGRDTQAAYPVWEELAIVNRIFVMFVVGEDDRGPLCLGAICNQLMDEGVVLAVGSKGHKPKNPKLITTNRIRSILTNCMFVARWRHLGQEYRCDRLLVEDSLSGEKRTAVPLAIYAAAQDRLACLPSKGKRSLTSPHLLSGVVVCGCCGRPLHLSRDQRGKTRVLYKCDRKRDTIRCDRIGMACLSQQQVDEWAIRSLAPWLAAEIRAVRQASNVSEHENRLAELERQLSVARNKEMEALSAALGVFDKEQLRALSSKLRGEREALERQALDLRALLSQNSFPYEDDLVLAQLSPQAAKTGLRAAIQWIAVTSQGLVALTKLGTFVGGRLVQRRPESWHGAEPRRAILQPDLASCAECSTWLPDLELFVAGRRQALGGQAELFSNDRLLPGYDDLVSRRAA